MQEDWGKVIQLDQEKRNQQTECMYSWHNPITPLWSISPQTPTFAPSKHGSYLQTWTLLNSDMNKLEIFQMRCLRRITGVSLHDHHCNKTIRIR